MKSHIAVCLAAVTLTSALEAGTIYTPHDRNTRLGTIDPTTGVGSDVGSFEQPEPGYRLLSNAFDTQGNMFSIAMLPGRAPAVDMHNRAPQQTDCR